MLHNYRTCEGTMSIYYPPVLALLSEVLSPLMEGIFVKEAAAACFSAAAMAADTAEYKDPKAQKRMLNLSRPLETYIVTWQPKQPLLINSQPVVLGLMHAPSHLRQSSMTVCTYSNQIINFANKLCSETSVLQLQGR